MNVRTFATEPISQLRKDARVIALGLALIMGGSMSLWAADPFWLGTGASADWFDPGNWSNGVVPTSNSNIDIFHSVTPTVYAPVISTPGAVVGSIMMGAPSSTDRLTVTGAGTLRAYGIIVGDLYGPTNELLVTSGGTVDLTVLQAGYASSRGTVTITGVGSKITTTRGLFSGSRYSSGYLYVENGGVLSAGTMELGEVFSSDVYAILNIKGTSTARGVLETTAFIKRNAYVGINVDGGIIRATASNASFFTGFGEESVSILEGGGYFDTQGYNVTMAGVFKGVGAFTKLGSGHLTLSGTNTYEGGTNILGGTVTFETANSLGTGTIAMSGSTLRWGSGNTTDVSSRFSELIDASFDTNGNNVSFASALSNGADELLDITKLGAGTLTLLGENTYTGGTRISGGVLQVGNGGTTGSVRGDIVNNASLIFNRSDAQSYSGVVSGSGSVTKTGAGTLTLSKANTYTGGTVLQQGVLRINQAAAIGTGKLTFQGGTLSSTADAILNNAGVLEAGGGTIDVVGGYFTWKTSLTGAGGLTKTGNNLLTLEGDQAYTGGTTIQGGTVKFTGAVASSEIRLNDVASKVIFANSQTFAGNISGRGVLEHEFGGTTSLTGSATHTGGTLISGGVLQVGNGGAAGSLAGNVSMSSNGTLVFNRSGSLSFSGAISGAGSLRQSGSGTLSLSGINSYTGATTVTSGTLVVAHVKALGTSAVKVEGGTLEIQSANISNIVTLAGGSLAQRVAAGTSLKNLNTFVDGVGGITAEVALLGGTASKATTITSHLDTESSALNDEIRMSNVLTLSGVPLLASGKTDIYVLQLSISDLDEPGFLGWLNESTGLWENAALTGGGTGELTFVRGAYNPTRDFHLGYYGVDEETGSVWAVLDHNGSFAIIAVPEPSVWALLGLSALISITLRRRSFLS